MKTGCCWRDLLLGRLLLLAPLLPQRDVTNLGEKVERERCDVDDDSGADIHGTHPALDATGRARKFAFLFLVHGHVELSLPVIALVGNERHARDLVKVLGGFAQPDQVIGRQHGLEPLHRDQARRRERDPARELPQQGQIDQIENGVPPPVTASRRLLLRDCDQDAPLVPGMQCVRREPGDLQGLGVRERWLLQLVDIDWRDSLQHDVGTLIPIAPGSAPGIGLMGVRPSQEQLYGQLPIKYKSMLRLIGASC